MITRARERLVRVLRWSERYTKTDMVYLAKNTTWLTFGQFGVAALAFVLSIAFAHFVPKDIYGTYRFLQSLFWTLTAFSLTGLPTAFARAIARGENIPYREAFGLSVLWSTPIALVALGMSGYYFLQHNNVLSIGCIVIAVFGPFIQSTYLYGAYLEGKRIFEWNAIFGIILNLIPTIFLLGAMMFTTNPLVFFGIYLAGNVGAALAISLTVWRMYPPSGTKPSESLFRLGAHFSVMNILATIASQIDQLLVYHYLGAVELAVYSFATAIPDQIKGIVSNLTTIAFPQFANRTPEEVRHTLPRRIAVFTGIMIVGTTFYIVVAPFLFHVLYPAYSDAIRYSQIYALGLALLGSVFPATALQAQAQNQKLYIFNIASSVFQIAILFPAVIFYGLLGVVASRFVSRAFNFALAYWLLR